MSKKDTQIQKVKPKIDKEKNKEVYRKDIVSLEILKTKETFDSVEEAEKYYNDRVQHYTYIPDDLSSNYIIRISVTEKKKELRSVDPDHIPEIDQYELSETIQDILREHRMPIIKSNFPQKEDSDEK
jgi:hypothetical protein